jgi:hypothetical protein
MLWPVLLTAAPERDKDILGPLGPMAWPEEAAPRPSARRLLAGAIAVGFVAFGLYYALRRRRRRRVRHGSADPEPAPLGEDLSDAEFYGRLLGAARATLRGRDGPSGRDPRSLTPRELADALPGGREWREVCLRAEAAQYGAREVGPERRRADAALVRRVIARPAGRG